MLFVGLAKMLCLCYYIPSWSFSTEFTKLEDYAGLPPGGYNYASGASSEQLAEVEVQKAKHCV